MMVNSVSHWRIKVTELKDFLTKPPECFSVETLSSGYRVRCKDETNLVLIDDFESSMGKIVFQTSLGSKVKVHNLWEYTSTRKSLLSKSIYLLMSASEENLAATDKKKDRNDRALRQFVVSINGNDPFLKWQMEKGLDWTISSVAGESYRVDIDLSEVLESWAAENITADQMQVKLVWTNTSFTLKYNSDALFDFPHWFGFSKRTFKLRLT